jgi:hypothetical protein
MTKSARLLPCHGACPILGHSPPASSTKIINYIDPIKRHKFSIINKWLRFHNFFLQGCQTQYKKIKGGNWDKRYKD